MLHTKNIQSKISEEQKPLARTFKGKNNFVFFTLSIINISLFRRKGHDNNKLNKAYSHSHL